MTWIWEGGEGDVYDMMIEWALNERMAYGDLA